ncbi:MAG: polyprenyl synthetase family protein [Alphaproteobacteria bacterium]|nr:polyprenyl synthetase family protein [Alphaproteobacteria bacterium]
MSTEPQAPSAMIGPALKEAASFAERTLSTLLPQPTGPQGALIEAMRAAVLAQDRGLRAFFVLQSGRLFGVDRQPLGRVCAAVECVIAACGLGAPSVGPLTLLAGEALMAEAFALLGSAEAMADPFLRAEAMARLAQCAGHAGLLGGQCAELVAGTLDAGHSLPQISRRQRMRIAALVGFCCEAGPLLAKASPSARHALSAYGQDVGLALAMAADLADPQSPTGQSVIAALGLARAEAHGTALAEQAVHHLDLFDEKADLLRAAARFAVTARE